MKRISLGIRHLAFIIIVFCSSYTAFGDESQTITVCGNIDQYAMTSDGRWLGLLLKDRKVLLWNVKQQRSQMITCNVKAFWGGFSLESDRFGLLTNDNAPLIWHLDPKGEWSQSTNITRLSVRRWTSQMDHPVFVPRSDSFLCLNRRDYKILKCNSRTAQCTSLDFEFGNPIWDMVVSSDGKTLCTSEMEGTEVWDLSTNKLMYQLHRTLMAKIVISPDNRFAAAIEWIEPIDGRPKYGAILVWHLASGEIIVDLELGSLKATSAVFSGDSKCLLFATAERSISVLPIGANSKMVHVPQSRRVDALHLLKNKRVVAFNQPSRSTLMWWYPSVTDKRSVMLNECR